jgi:hypothetical protein
MGEHPMGESKQKRMETQDKITALFLPCDRERQP